MGGLIFFATCLGIALIIDLCVRLAEMDGVKASISFDSFKSFYAINPNSWILSTYVVACVESKGCFNQRNIWFKFNYIDSIRYRLFRFNLNRNNQNAQATKNYNDMINIVKADIAAFEKKNKEETERMLNEIWNDRVK